MSISRIIGELEDIEVRMDSLETENAELREERDEALEERDEALEQNATLAAALEESTDIIERMQQSIRELEAELQGS